MKIKLFSKVKEMLSNGVNFTLEKINTYYDKKQTINYEINKLLDQKQYQKIIDKYNNNLNTFKKIKVGLLKTKDKKDLINDYRYLDLSEKYPLTDKEYKMLLKKEFEYETGLKYNIHNLRLFDKDKYKKTKLEKKNNFVHAFVYTGLICTILLGPAAINALSNIRANITNKEIIKEYDENLSYIASKYDNTKQDDLEIIVSVLNEVRSQTYYKFVDDLWVGDNYRLVLTDDNYYGVCRHMADKYTNIINMIDKDYKAYNLCVSLSGGTKYNDIRGLEYYDPDFTYSHSEPTAMSKLSEKVIANHLVSVVWSDQYDCYFVVDPTNPSIGVIEKGKIHMLNSDITNFIEYRPLSQYILFYKDFNKSNLIMLDSYIKNIDYNKLVNECGLEKQNEIIEKLKK